MTSIRPLGVGDSEAFVALVERNRAHLPEQWEATASADDLAAYLREPWDANVRFGVWVDGALAGRVDLVPVHPPHWTIGYWLGADHRGRGVATEACALAIEHARAALGATEVYAGVTHGNDASVRVLERLGFERVAELDTYDRWRLVL